MNDATQAPERLTREDGTILMPDLTPPPGAIAIETPPAESTVIPIATPESRKAITQRGRRMVAETQLRKAQQRADARAGRRLRPEDGPPPPERRNPTTYHRDGSIKQEYAWDARARVWYPIARVKPTTVAE